MDSAAGRFAVISAAMNRPARCLATACIVVILSACGGGGGGGDTPAPPGPVALSAQAWPSFGRDAQHSAIAQVATQELARILWTTPVDLAPHYEPSGELLAHYGSPLVADSDALVLPVKTGSAGGFRIEGHSRSTGALLWSQDSDYLLPPHRWTPSFNATLTSAGKVVAPAAGGRLLLRAGIDANAATTFATFYGAAAYAQNPAAFNGTVFVDTPVTADAQGNLFFGFVVTGPNPANVSGGVARIGADGSTSWVAAAAASGDASMTKAAMNSAPALSANGKTLYVAVNAAALPGVPQPGYLLALDAATLATKAKVALKDPLNGATAWVSDDGTASPTVAANGDVFFGVLENQFGSHDGRGWLLHFDAALAMSFVPGSFGWDITPSLVPSAMVPSYSGSSAQLLALKYNDYNGIGAGTGRNRLAVLDPGATQPDTISGITVMKEVLTILGPTAEGTSGAVTEWCINTMAVDPATHSILANNEDGVLYRWDLATNTFSQRIRLNVGLGEAYTPTAVGPDGVVYAISNATLYAIGR
jgi:hypothetical protein